MNDPIVEEIRGFRNDHAKKFNYELDAICEDFKTHQANCGHEIIRLKPKKLDNRLIQFTPESGVAD